MIEEIYIRNLGVIADARLSFGPGLTVLTGETGAGKTMVLTALGLLLGERSDATSIRSGQSSTSVEGRWALEPDSAVVQRALDAGAQIEHGELLINRSVNADGRSRASVGGASAPIGLLTELGEKLVVVHGQSEQIRLKSPVAQREALDRFAGAGLQNTLGEYQEHFSAWKNAATELARLKTQLGARIEEAERLRAAVAELEAADPQPGELENLDNEIQRLTHIEDIRTAVSAAHDLLSSDGFDSQDVLAGLGQARRLLEQAASHDAALQEKAENVRLIGTQLSELVTELGSFLASLDTDSGSALEQAQARKALLLGLVRKYVPDYEALLNLRNESSARLLELDSSSHSIEELEQRVERELAEVKRIAESLTKLREQAASTLASRVTQELQALSMGGSSLVVTVSNASEYSNFGKDVVSIQLSAYQGAEPRALSKGASGGELSRVMLAIEVILAEGQQAPTFVFDEVDAGVGGAAAIEVGRRLARLGRQSQVIVVTHLAQVAAFADTHLRVLKTTGDDFTQSDVVKLEDSERIEELTRMLSGLADSSSGRAHAAELLELSRVE
ncbi:MAG: repair protein RecN [Actinomycetota bacterium]